ncbi:MAG: TIGR03557 family F420-dependent LLM class oxidoreductase [Anaerolineae bacterium]|nr:TIGR03557 family F420-dependent LLM class oxidoreductase [Anaerolineae bacterium]
MVQFGYALSSEEHRPNDLVDDARRAEARGFKFALISDHFHPWVDSQGEGPFVWSLIGAIAYSTERMQLGTGVTCPLIRIHPAILAQAAATAAAMMPGRFFFGLGTGENLNEHVLGDHWPPYERRSDMLREAVEVIRKLWEGESTTFYGKYYTVENARLYTLPEQPIPIMIAAAGENSASLAGEIGDGLITTSSDAEVVQNFDAKGASSRPHYGKLTVCCHEDAAEARKIVLDLWPTAGLKGELSQELPTPAHFEQAAKNVTEEDIAEAIVCGNDVEAHKQKVQAFLDAGIEHIYVHQIGPDQDAMFKFYEKHIFPAFL